MEHRSRYSNLVARLEAIKQAADGAETSMPDDPSGDGTTDPRTGSQYEQYSKDINNIETVPPNAEDQPRASMSEDHEQENSFSTFTLSTAGSEAQSAKGEYKDRPDDPGTTMPAEAGQEKYSSAKDCTLEENIEVFNKCAEALIIAGQQYNEAVKQASLAANAISRFPVGALTKKAMDEGASPSEVDEVAALEALLQENPELIASLESLSPEELDSLAAVADNMDAEAASGVPADATPEDIALEKDSFYHQEPAIQKTLVSLDDAQLKQASANLDALMQKVAEGDVTEEELAAILAPAEEPAPEEAPAEEKKEDTEDSEEKEGGCCKKKGGCSKKAEVENMSAQDLYKYASAQDLYYLAMQKQAEEEQAAFESLSPEEQAMLESASDEELADAIAGSEEAASDPQALEALLGAESEEAPAEEAPAEEAVPAEEEPSSDEALNELAAAMDEQGITPEALEAASKEASADPDLCKIAQAVMQYRKSGHYAYKPATTEKAAKMRSISHKYLSEIFPR